QAVVPWCPPAQCDLVGRGHRRGTAVDTRGFIPAAVSGSLPHRYRAGFHHAGRCRARCPGSETAMNHLLKVRDLNVEFRSREGVARVLNGVSFHVDAGETLAILGESGSGKSVTAQAIMGILDSPPAFIGSGSILFEGRDLLTQTEAERRAVRGA